jgi:hypothetical protein
MVKSLRLKLVWGNGFPNFVFESEMNRMEEIKKHADMIVEDFFKRFLPDYLRTPPQNLART